VAKTQSAPIARREIVAVSESSTMAQLLLCSSIIVAGAYGGRIGTGEGGGCEGGGGGACNTNVTLKPLPPAISDPPPAHGPWTI